MTKEQRPGVWLIGMAVLTIAPGLEGCSRVLGPERMPVVAVTGVVTEGRRSVGGGWIEFIPVDGTVGKLRSASLNPDGSFQATGVAVGMNLVRIVGSNIESPAIARLFGTFWSPIRREISDVDPRPLAIDLLDEAVRFQATSSLRQATGGPAAHKGAP
jgi:hypothetical protein